MFNYSREITKVAVWKRKDFTQAVLTKINVTRKCHYLKAKKKNKYNINTEVFSKKKFWVFIICVSF